jgi:hypothetical protein
MAPASTTSAYDSSRSRPGCAVSAVCLSQCFSFLFSIFCVFVFYFLFCVWVWNTPWIGVAHSHLLAGSRSSTNRPSAHRATARHRQGSQKPAIAVSLAATALLAPPYAAHVAPPCSTAHPRVFHSPGHVHAHTSRLRRRPIPAEPVLLYVRQSGQARRRHGVALDEGVSLFPHTFPLFFSPSCLPASPLLFTSCYLPRMVRRDVPRDPSSRHFITSRIRRTTTETLASSSFRISACVRRGPTVSSSVCSK